MRLSDAAVGRDNNFNLIRMIAALCVLVSHAWPITGGPGTVEPLERLTGFTLGTLSVFVFFTISGFLITRSFDRQPTVTRWLAARILRLFPALVVVLVLTVAVLGPLVTTLPAHAYFDAARTLSYVPRNLSLAFLQYDLPGVFETNIYGPAINGSLWTLFYEVVCYAGVLVAGLSGLLRSRVGMSLGLGLLVLSYLVALHTDVLSLPGRVTTLLPLALPFAIGAVFYVWRERIELRLSWLAVLLGLMLAAWATPLRGPLLILALCYATFLLAYGPTGAIRTYNALGDYSYGVYIYAFPLQQLAVHLFGATGPLANIALALPPTLVLAALSWTIVERPSLSLLKRRDVSRAAG